eukprot:9097236-Pyramimonas_sp.AAC.1
MQGAATPMAEGVAPTAPVATAPTQIPGASVAAVAEIQQGQVSMAQQIAGLATALGGLQSALTQIAAAAGMAATTAATTPAAQPAADANPAPPAQPTQCVAA